MLGRTAGLLNDSFDGTEDVAVETSVDG